MDETLLEFYKKSDQADVTEGKWLTEIKVHSKTRQSYPDWYVKEYTEIRGEPPPSEDGFRILETKGIIFDSWQKNLGFIVGGAVCHKFGAAHSRAFAGENRAG